MTCDICGFPNCTRRARWPDGSRCREYVAVRGGAPPVPPLTTAAAPAPPRRSEAEAQELRLLIQECPHLVPKQPGDGCACIGRCKAGKGDLHDDRTSYGNCEQCQAGELD